MYYAQAARRAVFARQVVVAKDRCLRVYRMRGLAARDMADSLLFYTRVQRNELSALRTGLVG